MFTYLDLLIVVVMALVAVSLLAIVLMFLVKHPTVRRVCFYITVALGVYLGTVGVRIMWPGFPTQMALAVAMALVSIAALVLERLSKGDEKKFLIARVLASAAVVVGMVNAFMI